MWITVAKHDLMRRELICLTDSRVVHRPDQGALGASLILLTDSRAMHHPDQSTCPACSTCPSCPTDLAGEICPLIDWPSDDRRSTSDQPPPAGSGAGRDALHQPRAFLARV